jgi:hypothetical protein
MGSLTTEVTEPQGAIKRGFAYFAHFEAHSASLMRPRSRIQSSTLMWLNNRTQSQFKRNSTGLQSQETGKLSA